MKRKFRRVPKLFLAVSFSLALVVTTVLADIPDNLTDIVYQSKEWGSEQMRFRGYTLIHSAHHDGKNWEYWWQGSSNTCIQARAHNGRYEALKVTSSADCNQYHKKATKGNNPGAIALRAAARLRVSALAHKSHERDEKHGQDEKSVAEFDRGYRDGLHHERYHNYNNTGSYSDGYTAGQMKRDQETRHRAYSGHHSGYGSYVSLNDLVGAKASSANSALRSRGFKDMGGYKQDQKSFVTWYNQHTHQCVQTVTKEGRIKRFQSIDEGNCL